MRRSLTLALAAAACGGPPSSTPDAGFDWAADLASLDDAVLSVWTGGDQAIAVGGSNGRALLLEWNGGPAWTAPALPEDASLLWWTFGEPGGDAWAVGEGATLLRRAAGLWRQEPLDDVVPPGQIFYGVWGAAEDDVWVVGGSFNAGVPRTVILHWDGSEWRAEELAGLPEAVLFKVWGSGAADVWAVGEAGTTLHWDGAAWLPVDSSTGERLIAVYGRDAGDVFAVGGDTTGLVLHWDGAVWTGYARLSEPLAGVWTAPARPLYVAGSRGLVARFRDAATFVEARPLAEVDLHSLSGDATRVLACGADLLGGGAGRWNGAILSHGAPTATGTTGYPYPDAAPPPDAPPGPGDATVLDGAPDAAPPDAHWPSHGEECEYTDGGMGAPPIPRCAAGLTCWHLQTTGIDICTQDCALPAECSEYGASACCKRPGFQTLTTVCLPSIYIECTF